MSFEGLASRSCGVRRCYLRGSREISLVSSLHRASIGIDMVPSIIDVWGYDREYPRQTGFIAHVQSASVYTRRVYT